MKNMISYKNEKAAKAKVKMMNLAAALSECGIQADLVEDHDNNIISLSATMWNCIDGTNVEVCVYAMKDEDYKISSYAEPEKDLQHVLDELSKL